MYQTPKFAGAFRYNAQKNRATLLCRACLDEPICVAVMYLTLRTGCERYGRKNPLPYSFSERSHIGNLRQTLQGKGEIHKRVETAGVYPLVPPPGRRTPRWGSAENFPPVRGEHACGSSSTPVSRCRERSRPVRANLLTQFACPGQPVQKTSLVFKLNCFSDNATAKRHTQAETA